MEAHSQKQFAFDNNTYTSHPISNVDVRCAAVAT